MGLAWNEVSRRYVDSEPEFYFPEVWRGRPVNAKQGSSGIQQSSEFIVNYDCCVNEQDFTEIALGLYLQKVKDGCAPEQARMVLPLNTHTEWIWSGSLAAFARVCKLRLDPHAQKECTDTVQPIYDILLEKFPVSTKALVQ